MDRVVPSSRHIGIIDARRKSKGQFGDRDIGWIVTAANHFCRLFLKRIYPEDPVWTVDYYTDISSIDLATVWPMALMDDDGLDGALGHHYVRWGIIGGAVDCLGRSFDDITSTLLHELEMCFNPYIINWAELPDGRETPREAGDPVQWSSFPMTVAQEFGGVRQRRTINVQNMVGARYWGELPNETSVPFDIKGEVREAHQWPLRGYRVIKDGDRRYNEFGQADSVIFGSRKFGGASRTRVLVQGGPQLVEKNGVWRAAFDGEEGTGADKATALSDLRRKLAA